MRGTEMLGREGVSARSRARTMLTLQRNVGNNRVSNLIGNAQRETQQEKTTPGDSALSSRVERPETAEPEQQSVTPSNESEAATAVESQTRVRSGSPTEPQAQTADASVETTGRSETAGTSPETNSPTKEAEISTKESIAFAQHDARDQAVEALAQAESFAAETEVAAVPSLVALIEPAPDEASDEDSPGPTDTAMSGSGNTTQSAPLTPGTGTASFSLDFPTKVARMPVAQREDQENDGRIGTSTKTEPYDPIAARSSVQRLISVLTSASTNSYTRIQQQAENTKVVLTENAEAVRQSVHMQIAAAIRSVQVAFVSERAVVQSCIGAAREQIDAALQSRHAEALSQGEEAKASLTDLFHQHRVNVSTTVEASVADVDAMRSRHIDAATRRTHEQARDARHGGLRKSARYPATERGFLQGEAVEGVANRTAEEMEARLPATVEAIAEIVEDIPDGLRNQGEEALNGIDEGLPDLLARIDENVAAVTVALDNQAMQANEQLNVFETELMAQLESAEIAAIVQAEALAPQADAQIDAGLETAFSELDAATIQACDQLEQIVQQAVAILAEIETPEVEGAVEMADQILAFISGATEETISAQLEAGAGMGQEFARIDEAAAEGLQAVERRIADQLPALTDSVNSALSNVIVQLDEGFGRTITGMSEAFEETRSQILEQLTESVDQLAIDFAQTLSEADVEVTNARNEGLAENDEALAQLEPQMQEAADDAAWEHDHPVLSTITSIGAIVLGVIAGILLVIAMVVVAIIAFKLLIAGLILLGVSAAVAKIIAAVIGIGLLAHAIYSAYQARIAAGEAGGWGTFGGALLDVIGITDMRRAFTQPGLSPFERGFAFGRGLATVGTFFLGRRLNQRINARLPRSITNPTRGAGWRWLRGQFGTRPPAPGAPRQLPAPRQRGNQNPIGPRGPIPVNPPIRITPRGLQHVTERHTIPGLPQYAGKSKFNIGENIVRLIQEGTQQPMVRQPNGNFARTFDVGRLVGVDRTTGRQTSIMTIITRADGTLVTAFPGRP